MNLSDDGQNVRIWLLYRNFVIVTYSFSHRFHYQCYYHRYFKELILALCLSKKKVPNCYQQWHTCWISCLLQFCLSFNSISLIIIVFLMLNLVFCILAKYSYSWNLKLIFIYLIICRFNCPQVKYNVAMKELQFH